ncbi:Bax inhibitor-1 family protein [Abeliophyllum distichum]|uniref:Bax inhibitor-1 family protein n=1 Tax=Abeliophyllum distichum TaxID=126358 RepID=A0ABD1Q0V7_9LAMI
MSFYTGSKNNVDIEAGNNGQLYPGMQEHPQLRWAFIRKVYSILCIQLLITFGVALGMFFIRPIREFMHSTSGLYTMIALIVVTFILCILMHYVSKRHPWNYVVMFLFTFAMAFMIGAVCNQKKGETVLMAAGLTLLVTVGLTVYTFWAAKRGQDFSFLGPFLLCALLLLFAFGLIRILFPMGRIAELVIGCIGALVFSGFIIYDTDNLIKRFDYDEYIEAACSLFLDIINLFMYVLMILNGDE